MHFIVLNVTVVLCGAETCTLRKIDQKYLEGFEITC